MYVCRSLLKKSNLCKFWKGLVQWNLQDGEGGREAVRERERRHSPTRYDIYVYLEDQLVTQMGPAYYCSQ